MGATYEDQQRFLKRFHDEAFDITQTKGQDYTPDGISLLELLPSCVEADVSPEQGLWILYRKHFAAIRKHFFHGQPLVSESPRNRLLDAVNYFGLLAWFDTNRYSIYKAWWDFWKAQTCECELRDATEEEPQTVRGDLCQRCETLCWMVSREFITDSEEISSHLTRREPA